MDLYVGEDEKKYVNWGRGNEKSDKKWQEE